MEQSIEQVTIEQAICNVMEGNLATVPRKLLVYTIDQLYNDYQVVCKVTPVGEEYQLTGGIDQCQ